MVTQRQLLAGAWGRTTSSMRTTCGLYMTGLRRKLERDPRLPAHILTEPGVGYRLVIEALSDARTPWSAPPAVVHSSRPRIIAQFPHHPGLEITQALVAACRPQRGQPGPALMQAMTPKTR